MRYDEELGGPRDPNNFLSFPKHGAFHKATARALPWTEGEAAGDARVKVPSVFVEGLFRLAPTGEPEQMHDPNGGPEAWTMLTHSLGVDEYLSDALELLLAEGLLKNEDDEDVEFAQYQRAGATVEGRPVAACHRR